jgi:hypothetical protein
MDTYTKLRIYYSAWIIDANNIILSYISNINYYALEAHGYKMFYNVTYRYLSGCLYPYYKGC